MPHAHLASLRKFALLLSALACSGLCTAQPIVNCVAGIGNDTTATVYGRLYNMSSVVAASANEVVIKDNSGGMRSVNLSTGILAPYTAPGGRGVLDAAGNWYFVNAGKVYKKTPAGSLSHIAGNGSSAYSGDGGPATAAGTQAIDVAVDLSGNIFIADDYRVRKVNTAGIISTIAGSGLPGFSGDGGPAILAQLRQVKSVAVDAAGNLFVADYVNNRIRMVNSAGTITTIAGNGSINTTGDGGPATSAAIDGPLALRCSNAGELHFVSSYVNRVRKVNASGIISTVAGTIAWGMDGDGGPATAAHMGEPTDISFGPGGDMFLIDSRNRRIRRVNTAGIITTVAGNGLPVEGFGGDGGSGLLAVFNNIGGFTTDAAGNFYVADEDNFRVRKVTATTTSTLAGVGVTGFSGDGGPATAAVITRPGGIALDKYGNLYIALPQSNRVRKVTPGGIITSFAGGGSGGLGDGGPATNATLLNPLSVVTDTAGNVYIADNGNSRIRKVNALTGNITTFAGDGSGTASGDAGPASAAGLNNPMGLTFDKYENLYIAGSTIRKIDLSGIITSIPVTGSEIAVDTIGNIYVVSGITVKRYDIYGYTSVPIYPATNVRIDGGNNLYFGAESGIRKKGPLSTIVDHPPLFVKGIVVGRPVCISSTGNSLDTCFSVSDADAGQTLTWSLISGPSHGTIAGLPFSAATTTGMVTPTGITYTPAAGYSGTDVVRIKVTDGEDTAMIQVNITVNSTPPGIGSISGISGSLCAGASVDLNNSTPGGTWAMKHGFATINDTGLVTGITTGVDTAIYTVANYCGPASVTRTVNVIEAPIVQITLPIDNVCVGASPAPLYGTPTNGTWSSASPNVSIVNKKVEGVSPGTAVITYAVTNTCGTGYDYTTITIYPQPSAGAIAGPSIACPGESHTFSSTVPGGTWSVGASAIATISAGGVLAVSATGTVVVSYAVSSPCGNWVSTKKVTVPAAPPVLHTMGPTVMCEGSINDLDNPTPGGVWSSTNTAIATVDANGVVHGVSPGTAGISYTVTNGCGIGATSVNMLVEAAPALTPITGKSVVLQGGTAGLRGRSPIGQWSSSTPAVATIDQWGLLTGVAAGTAIITYTETGTNGCSASETLQVTVTTSGIIEFTHQPNPAAHSLSISYSKSTAPDADIWLADATGRIVFREKLAMPGSSATAQLDISALPAGAYTVHILSAGGNYTGKLVVLR